MNEASMKEFQELINDMIEKKFNQLLKENNIYQTVSGKIIANSTAGKYDVDLGDTTIKSIYNRTGQSLEVGDAVLVNVKCGSNYSQCYITEKTGCTNA